MKSFYIAATSLTLASPILAAELPSEINFKPAAQLSGKAVVRNGIEIKFGEVEIRLRGIQSPHKKDGKAEPGSEAAYDKLTQILSQNSDQDTVCLLDGTRAEAKPVGVCFINWESDGVANAQDIGKLMVASGHALDCPRFSGGMYADAEKAAVAAGEDLSATYKLPASCNKS